MFKFTPLVAAMLVASAPVLAADNTSEQNQIGIDNVAEVLQSGGSGNMAEQNQGGFANDASIEQLSSFSSTAVQNQFGNFNDADALQRFSVEDRKSVVEGKSGGTR